MKKITWITFLTVLLFCESAYAFCGFYVGGAGKDLFNDASMVVMMRDGTRTVLSMQNDYAGPPDDFALVIPVPQVLQKENVKTLPNSVFAKIDQLASPRLVEYWEQDPCRQTHKRTGKRSKSRKKEVRSETATTKKPKPTVKIEAQFDVGEYNIVVLSANDSTALDTWLRQNKYNIPKGAEKHFRPYIEKGQFFFVAKVDSKKLSFAGGRAQLSPLRFHYNTGDFTLPTRLGLINSRGAQDLIVHILAKNQRYEAGNYKNVTIPTNIELKPKAKAEFGPFYATLFDRVMEENPNAVITEYAWQATKCDPCPGGSVGGGGLSQADLATLGADVINQPVKKKKGSYQGELDTATGRKPMRRPPTSNWTLTRLHTRYGKNSVGQDIVFRKAKPILGGRQFDDEKRAKMSNNGMNQFQGRYIIRNKWKGAVKCKSPKYGIWGGPSGRGAPDVAPAPKTAYIKKRAKLESLVRGKLPKAIRKKKK